MIVNQMEPQLRMKVTAGSDMLTSSLRCLVTHFLCVIKKVEGNRTLLSPLLALVEAPNNVNVCMETTTCTIFNNFNIVQSVFQSLSQLVTNLLYKHYLLIPVLVTLQII